MKYKVGLGSIIKNKNKLAHFIGVHPYEAIL